MLGIYVEVLSITLIALIYLAKDTHSQSVKKTVSGDALFEYNPTTQKSTSDILKSTLVKEDFEDKVKFLPNKRDIVLHLSNQQDLKLLFAINSAGPVRLSLSPCYGIIKWELYWRPYPATGLEIVQKESLPPGENASTKESLSEKSEDNPVEKTFRKQGNQIISKLKRGSFGTVQLFEGNFSLSDFGNSCFRYINNDTDPTIEILLNHGEGRDPWLFQREISQPGLYIIKVRSVSTWSRIHALGLKSHVSDIQREREVQSFKVKDTCKRSVILSWKSKFHEGKIFCLSVSRLKFYSSLCAARELQQSSKTLPPPLVDESLILGCTPNTFYRLPITENSKYFVSMWQEGSLIPVVQATINVKSHRKVQRLKPGVMVQFTLTAGGQITAKFNVKKRKKKLHVGAVSCYGGVKVVVMAGKERVATAKGREALHLAVRHIPKSKLTIKVSPQPPIQALYRVHLVVTHSSRKLPIPRLPKNAHVKVNPVNCTSAEIKWNKAKGGAKYCIVFRRHPSGRPPEIRPPLQCGWEEVIRRHDYFDFINCMDGQTGRIQRHIITGLTPHQSFLINVVVRHRVTGKS